MKAATFRRPGVVEIEEYPVQGPRDGELLVKVEVALTCGTDVKTYRRGHPLARPPIIMGHEFAGTIVSVGGGLDMFREGQRVTSANTAPCGMCYYCLKDRPNLCERLDHAILGFNWPGAYAQFVRIPAHIVKKNTFVVPDDVSAVEAAFLEPLACVVHGAMRSGMGLGDSVVILGSGPIGLLHAQIARMKGASKVIVIDRHDNKLRVAEKVGADKTINLKEEDPLPSVKGLTDGRGADVVMEAVGKPEAWEMAVGLARKGGAIVFFGGCPPRTKALLDTQPIHYGELTLMGAFHHTPESVERAFNLICSGRLKLKELVSDEMPLERLNDAFQAVIEGRALKIAIKP